MPDPVKLPPGATLVSAGGQGGAAAIKLPPGAVRVPQVTLTEGGEEVPEGGFGVGHYFAKNLPGLTELAHAVGLPGTGAEWTAASEAEENKTLADRAKETLLRMGKSQIALPAMAYDAVAGMGKEAWRGTKGTFTGDPNAPLHMAAALNPFAAPVVSQMTEQGLGTPEANATGTVGAAGLAAGPIGSRVLPLAARVAAPVLRATADSVSPDLVGVFSPRLAHAQRLAGRLANVLEATKSTGRAAGATQAPPDVVEDMKAALDAQARAAAGSAATGTAQATPAATPAEAKPNVVQMLNDLRASVAKTAPDEKSVVETYTAPENRSNAGKNQRRAQQIADAAKARDALAQRGVVAPTGGGTSAAEIQAKLVQALQESGTLPKPAPVASVQPVSGGAPAPADTAAAIRTAQGQAARGPQNPWSVGPSKKGFGTAAQGIEDTPEGKKILDKAGWGGAREGAGRKALPKTGEAVTLKDGTAGKVESRAFGKFTIRLEDGTKKTVTAAELGPRPGTPAARAAQVARARSTK